MTEHLPIVAHTAQHAVRTYLAAALVVAFMVMMLVSAVKMIRNR